MKVIVKYEDHQSPGYHYSAKITIPKSWTKQRSPARRLLEFFVEGYNGLFEHVHSLDASELHMRRGGKEICSDEEINGIPHMSNVYVFHGPSWTRAQAEAEEMAMDAEETAYPGLERKDCDWEEYERRSGGTGEICAEMPEPGMHSSEGSVIVAGPSVGGSDAKQALQGLQSALKEFGIGKKLFDKVVRRIQNDVFYSGLASNEDEIRAAVCKELGSKLKEAILAIPTAADNDDSSAKRESDWTTI